MVKKNTEKSENWWSEDQYILLNKIRENSIVLSYFHKEAHEILKNRHKYFKIPIIILSSVCSVFSVTLTNFLNELYVSLIVCTMNLTISMIGSIEMYLNIEKQSQKEDELARKYYLLSIEIYKMLELEEKNRPLSGKDYLEEAFNKYHQLIENSNVQRLRDKLVPIEKNPSVNTGLISNKHSKDSFELDIEKEKISI
jgi:hypothetical protein